ncbi:phosphoribosylglycinamide formyltransferase [Candidatus Nitrosacidococcus tergens]|uniref:Phosphoribosylglycinamide formyltransferase n=1 Tax=Candidatus Nitrosacidococcus tergens TaxID=553981 RepID=A0A7G1QA83_9GAMM|nr:phosphoribosylglycinamide formyltransferase [Candidatus Nitrosacidococcus tergens]CAB1276489.1 phosphoribosylglycinamide formyltransferase 1 [Candidatus Nitrosacidococcus tergens]
MSTKLLPIVVLISGRGSNFFAILEQVQAGKLPVDIRAVISNCSQAQGLHYAQQAGIKTHILDHRKYRQRQIFDRELIKIIDFYTPELVVLAGFMRILTAEFVQYYIGRLMNIHPSLLPEFPGLNTHQRALEAKVCEHGATVHFVTEEVDGGPIILQAKVPIYKHDTPEILADRVLEEEHKIYPQAILAFAKKEICLSKDGQVIRTTPSVK